MKSDVPPMLVEQRIRNRLYEYADSVAMYPAERGTWDLTEVVNAWEDYVSDPFDPGAFPAPAFVPSEVAALSDIHAAWLAFANSLPKRITDEPKIMETSEWRALVVACSRARDVFAARGVLPEEELLVHEV